jgi:peptidoglycan/xylan/chitin deacetylase (PgdA/CDA1 family)
LGDISKDEILYQLIQSKQDIESHTGKPVFIVAYPYGNYSSLVGDLLVEAGYRGGVLYDMGIEDIRTINLSKIKRVAINEVIDPLKYSEYLGLQ